MSKKVRIELNRSQIGALLRDAEMQDVVGSVAAGIAGRAGEGYSSDTKRMGTRVIASAFPETEAAYQDCMENNTLLRSLS